MIMKPSASTEGWTAASCNTDCSVGRVWYDCGKSVRLGGGYGGRPKVLFSDVDLPADARISAAVSRVIEIGKSDISEEGPLEEGVFIYSLGIDGLGGTEFCPPENDDPACPR